MSEGWKYAACAAVGGGVGAAAMHLCASKNIGEDCHVERERELREHVIPYKNEVERWSPKDVAAWMVVKGVSIRTAVLFESHSVDGGVLPSITKEVITEMGVTLIGDKLKLEKLLSAITASQATNPLSPEAGNLPKQVPVAALAPAKEPESETDPFDAKYKEVVQGHVKSLNKIVAFLSSTEFLRSPPKVKKAQLQKIVELLSKLIEFTDELPERHGAVLLAFIQEVYQEVKKHDVESDDEEAEETGATRLAKIRELKKFLVENPDTDAPQVMLLLKEVVGDIDSISDEEEIKELNEVFKMLQSRTGDKQKQVRVKEEESASANEAVKKLLMAARLFDADFIKQSLQTQEERIKLGTQILHEYEDSPHYDPSIADRLKSLIQSKIDEHMLLKNKAGEPSSPLAKKLQSIVKLLQEDEFPALPLEQQFKILEHAYQTLDGLSQDELSANYPLTSQLVTLLKKRHAETSDHKVVKEAMAKHDEEAQEEEEEEVVERASKDTTPQNEINLLPKVYQRLKADDFEEGTSSFEFTTLLWVVAQISQVLQTVVPQSKFRELMEPVHKMLMVRMDQAKALAAPNVQGLAGYTFVQEGDSFKFVEGSEPGHVVEEVAVEAGAGGDNPLVAILVGCDTPDGTEALELQHMAYMLKKELGYKVIMLLAGEADKEGLESALAGLPDASLVVVRGGSNSTAGAIKLAGGEVDLDWVVERCQNPLCSVIMDFMTNVHFATHGQKVSLELTEEVLEKAKAPCTWLFNGLVTPLLTEILVAPPSPPTVLQNLVNALQVKLVGAETFEPVTMEAVEAGLAQCHVSHGLQNNEGSETPEEEEEEAGE